MTKPNATDLATKIAGLTRDLAALDAERGRVALQAEQGGSAKPMADLAAKRAELVAAIEQADLARMALQRSEELEARTEARHREDARQAEAMAKVEAFKAEVAEVDVLVVALRDKLQSVRTRAAEVQAMTRDPMVLTSFFPEVAARVMTVLSGSGFAFPRLPFNTKDLQGRPEATEQALAPRVPIAHLHSTIGINRPPRAAE